VAEELDHSQLLHVQLGMGAIRCGGIDALELLHDVLNQLLQVSHSLI
jgi:hypothetical protein